MGFVSSMISYADFQEGGSLWLSHVPIALVLFFLADSIVMPVERTENTLTFHHLWRTSTLHRGAIRFLWISNGGSYDFLWKSNHLQMVCVGKCPWKLYAATCDNENNLADELEKLQSQ